MGASLLQDFIAETARRGLTVHGAAVQQHGRLLDEHHWIPDLPHVMHSFSKSFLSAGIGMALEEGRFGLHDRVVEYFPGERPAEVSPELAALTVRDLLIMAPGHRPVLMGKQRGEVEDPNWVRYYLSTPMEEMPGQHFVYDTGCTYLLSALLQKTTGQTALDYLRPRLFTPLGIEDPVWWSCPMGITIGGAGLYLRLREMLPFGQLYLQKGSYNGQQLVPEHWVEQSTCKQIDNSPGDHPDWYSGYGYQFWVNHDASFRGDGLYGQFCIVLPQRDAVIAITAGERHSTRSLMDAIWQTIVPKLD